MASSSSSKSLLSALESENLPPENLFTLFSAFLQPFASIKIRKNPTKSQQSQIRSLAKQFLPFLNTSLTLLPKRLLSTNSQTPQTTLLDLFRIYRLCLHALHTVSSQLACKPWAVDVQRVRMVHCYVANAMYSEAETEALNVFESLRGFHLDTQYNNDRELGFLVVEVVATLVKCAAHWRRKDITVYQRVLALVRHDATPFFQ